MPANNEPLAEPIPSGAQAQETPGLAPQVVQDRYGRHWSLGTNYYLSRGQSPPLVGSPLDPKLYHDPESFPQIPGGCSAPSACEPMEFCATFTCPHGTTPMRRNNASVCAGPGPLTGR